MHEDHPQPKMSIEDRIRANLQRSRLASNIVIVAAVILLFLFLIKVVVKQYGGF